MYAYYIIMKYEHDEVPHSVLYNRIANVFKIVTTQPPDPLKGEL